MTFSISISRSILGTYCTNKLFIVDMEFRYPWPFVSLFVKSNNSYPSRTKDENFIIADRLF